MNEKIRELAEQANWKFADKVTGEFTDYDKRIQKFAELIVRECVGIALKDVTLTWDWTEANTQSKKIAADLQQHFGVEL